MTRGNISAEDAYVQTANPKSQNHSLLDFLAYGDNQRSNFRGMDGGVRTLLISGLLCTSRIQEDGFSRVGTARPHDV